MPTFNPDALSVTVTFTNKIQTTIADFKASIESALASVADDLSGEINPPEGQGTGVVIGNG